MSWDACTMEPSTWLRWIECHPGTMSMAQGLGTFLAIFAAVSVPVVIRWREETFEARNYKRRLTAIIDCMAQSLTNIVWCMRTIDKERDPVLIYLNDLIETLTHQVNVFGAMHSDSLLRPEIEMTLIGLRERVKISCREFNAVLVNPDCHLFEQIEEQTKTMAADLDKIESAICGGGVVRKLGQRIAWRKKLRGFRQVLER